MLAQALFVIDRRQEIGVAPLPVERLREGQLGRLVSALDACRIDRVAELVEDITVAGILEFGLPLLPVVSVVVITETQGGTQPLGNDVQPLLVLQVRIERTPVVAAVSRSSDIGHRVVIGPLRVTAPVSVGGFHGEGRRGNLVDSRHQVVGSETGRPAALEEDSGDVEREFRRGREVEVDVRTDIPLRVFQLRGVVVRLGVVEESVGTVEVEHRIVAQLRVTTPETQVIGLREGHLAQGLLLPVDIGIDVGIGVVLEGIHFVGIVVGRESVVGAGLVERIGVGVRIDHLGQTECRIKATVVTHLDIEFLRGSALGFHVDHAVDRLEAVPGNGRGILEDRHRLDFVERERIDGTLESVDQNQDVVVRQRVLAAHGENGSVVVVEAAVLQRDESGQASVQGILQGNGTALADLVATDRDGRFRRCGIGLLKPVSEHHLLLGILALGESNPRSREQPYGHQNISSHNRVVLMVR